MSLHLDPGFGEHIIVDGMLVEKKAHDIVMRIKEYDPSLEVLCVDPAQCGISEAPFILAEVVGDQVYKVFEFWQLDESLLERVYLADTSRVDVLAMIDKNNQAIRNEENRRYKEKREAAADLVAHIIENNKSKYTFRNEEDKLVTVYDDRPYEVKP